MNKNICNQIGVEKMLKYACSAEPNKCTHMQLQLFLAAGLSGQFVKHLFVFLCGKRISLTAYTDDFTNQAKSD